MFGCGESLRALVTLYPKPLIRNNTSSEPSKPSDHVRAKHKPNSPPSKELSAGLGAVIVARTSIVRKVLKPRKQQKKAG